MSDNPVEMCMWSPMPPCLPELFIEKVCSILYRDVLFGLFYFKHRFNG